MPYVYLYACDRCSYEVEVTLCREYWEPQPGRREDFAYPDPEVYEWPPRQVSGIWSHLWCGRCRAIRTYPLVELDGPAEHPVQAFLAAEARGMTGEETGPCPECGTPLRFELEEEPCPGCAGCAGCAGWVGGRLRCIGEYEP